MPEPTQLELDLFVSADVAVTRFPDGEVRMKAKAPMIEGGTKDASRVLGVSRQTVIRLAEEGLIEGWVPAKRKWRFNMATVYALKQKRRAGSEHGNRPS